MIVQNDGSLEFTGRDQKIFIFKKDNYEEHCLKRPALKLEFYLENIEQTLQDPDCIASGPQEEKEIYYKVLNNIGIEQVYVLKIPVFRFKSVYYIASAHDFWTSSTYVIHYLEKVIWRKVNFLLF